MITPLLPTYARAPVAFERGEGPYLFSTDGRRFLDFGAGIAVNALGHAHPHLVAALTDQAAKVWHTSNIFQIPLGERLAARLVAATFADTVFFCNSGAEAIECAIKMTRKYHSANGEPQRYRLITFEGAFHGRTLATIAAGGQKKHLDGFGPKVEGFDQARHGDLAAVKAAIGPETAGILIEPIQGEGGIRAASPEFLRGLRALCDEHGLLLVLDEIQTGFGRTGKLFAHEWAGITPDIMAVANAVLDVVLEPAFLPHVIRIANYLKQQLAMLADKHGAVIEEVRGHGLLLGLKCKVPNGELIDALRERGLLAVGAGDNVVRILPPLIISEEHVREAVGILNDACLSLTHQPAKDAAK